MASFMDLTGHVYGRLTVLFRAPDLVMPSATAIRWCCQCTCGQLCIVIGRDMRRGHTTSCGCLRRQGDNHRTHGMSGTPEHLIWKAMKTRCSNPNTRNWEDYGGRGITVCPEWRDSFEQFYADLGPRPSPEYSLDRIDVNGNYEPGNVRWATASEQAKNKRPYSKPRICQCACNRGDGQCGTKNPKRRKS